MKLPAKVLTLLAFLTAVLFLPKGYSGLQVDIIASPAQSFVVCARNVQGDGTVILVAEENDPPDRPASTVVTTQLQTSLQLASPSPCLPGQTRQSPYSAKGLVHSGQPFLATFSLSDNPKKTDHKKHIPGTVNVPLPLSPVSSPPYQLLTGGGTYGPNDEDHSPKRPYWNPWSSQRRY